MTSAFGPFSEPQLIGIVGYLHIQPCCLEQMDVRECWSRLCHHSQLSNPTGKPPTCSMLNNRSTKWVPSTHHRSVLPEGTTFALVPNLCLLGTCKYRLASVPSCIVTLVLIFVFHQVPITPLTAPRNTTATMYKFHLQGLFIIIVKLGRHPMWFHYVSLSLSLSLPPPGYMASRMQFLPNSSTPANSQGFPCRTFTRVLQADCRPFSTFLQMYTLCSIGPTIFKKMNSVRFHCLPRIV